MADLHELFSVLALQKILYQYPRLANRLMSDAGSAKAVFCGDRDRFRGLFGGHEALWQSFREFDSWDVIEGDWKRISSSGILALATGDVEYPQMLKLVCDPPPVIFVRGRGRELLNAPCVGIVGARKASQNGMREAHLLAEGLARRGFCAVSGMAYGIDAAAHRGALDGGGWTIAVFGCGIDTIYPPSHEDLSREIAEYGLLMSEFPLGTRPFKQNFPQRNRIISGLSIAVIVVEAANGSGSLITARCALEQGRDVYAVPGAGGTCASRGSNGLIRDGAALVEDADEVADLLEKELARWPFLKKPGHFDIDVGMDSPLLKFFPLRGDVAIDYLVGKTGLPTPELLEALTNLAMRGAIEEVPGRRFRLKGK